jgi:hypothetical protein
MALGVFRTPTLQELLQEAQSLPQATSRQEIPPIGLRQLGTFYSLLIAGDDDGKQEHADDPSRIGGQFLAKKSIDCAKANRLIKDLTAKPKAAAAKSVAVHSRCKLSGFSGHEQRRQNALEDEWASCLKDMISFFAPNAAVIKKRKAINAKRVLFPQGTSDFASLARLFASKWANADGPKHLALINACCSTVEEQSGRGIRLDIFRALLRILDRDDRRPHKMLCGSVEFLSEQFRRRNFPKGDATTLDDINKFVAKKHPTIQKPWAHIWFALRGSFFGLVEPICRAHREQTATFWTIFERFVLGSEQPSSSDRANFFSDLSGLSDSEAFRPHVFAYVVGYDDVLQPPAAILATAEDYLFATLAPLRFDGINLGSDSIFGPLNDVQLVVRRDGQRHFSAGSARFVGPLLSLLCLDFEAAASRLLEIGVFPVEAVHVCIILRMFGLWSGTEYPRAVRQFVSLLPPGDTALRYLATTGDRDCVVKYLLALDIDSVRIDIGLVSDLVREEIYRNPLTVSTFKLLLLGNEFDGAQEALMLIADQSNDYSEPELVKLIGLIPTYIARAKSAGKQLEIVKNLALRLTVATMCRGDQLYQSDRGMLTDAAERLLIVCEEDELLDVELSNVVRHISKLLKILIYINAGMMDKAIETAKAVFIIPKNSSDVARSVEWLRSNNLPSFGLVGEVAFRLFVLLIEDKSRNERWLDAIDEWITKLPLPESLIQAFVSKRAIRHPGR